MSLISNEIWREFSRKKIGLLGIGILVILFAMSAIAFLTIPLETLKEWNDPTNWLTFPKSAKPAWMNYFLTEKMPEHMILQSSQIQSQNFGEISLATNIFNIDYHYDEFPSDFVYEYTAKYSGSPLLQITAIRPDGQEIQLISTSLPQSQIETSYHGIVFSTDDSMIKNLRKSRNNFMFPTDSLLAQDIVFSRADQNKVLDGHYSFKVNLYNINSKSTLVTSKFILGGKVYGFMGTDELRRDLAIGLLWGTPFALFIGITVAIGSVAIGLLYGIFAGYKGKLIDESLMRFNDIIYAMPVLPLLIILAVTVGNSIFLIVGFLVIFGWVGIAKVSRSMALQIKTLDYVKAAEIMGQKDRKIILKHILPQLLPYAFASIAISVPGAITTEAGLSFLGLGDPSFPTWGQILHDASVYDAAARGLWWWILPPGIMIAVTGLAFVFMGHAMDVVSDPRLKR